MEMSNRKKGIPVVKADRSFLEIVSNFTDPREVIREAISNALDWCASTVKTAVYEDATRADRELVIEIWDNGLGLTKERFFAFWNLADSPGLQRDKFGRKLGDRLGKRVMAPRRIGSVARSKLRVSLGRTMGVTGMFWLK